MEAKLREYRALRRRKELEAKEAEENNESDIKTLVNFDNNMLKEVTDETLLIPLEEKQQPVNLPEDTVSVTSEIEPFEGTNQESRTYFLTKWFIYICIWLTLYAFFLKLQFGSVFFAISVLIGICLNTRTGPKQLGEVSAYSVFNEDCKSIEGTLTAEQFEQEIRFGPGSVR